MAIQATTLFPTDLVAEMYSKVKGHSALANLSGQTPIPFNGTSEFVFSADDEASLVGEGGAKPANEGTVAPVVIRPVKFVYQLRVTDEWDKTAESKLNYLQTFADAFAKKIARALDIAAIHGVDPKTGTAAASLAANNFDALVTNQIVYDAAGTVVIDDAIDDAIALLKDDTEVTGFAMAPAMGKALGQVKANGIAQYPEFRFGGKPATFGTAPVDVNGTVSKGTKDLGLIGDFQGAFKWGYTENVPMEVIEYGDPDGAGRDLKQYNEVCLRAEAYIGWGILDADAFTSVVSK